MDATILDTDMLSEVLKRKDRRFILTDRMSEIIVQTETSERRLAGGFAPFQKSDLRR